MAKHLIGDGLLERLSQLTRDETNWVLGALTISAPTAMAEAIDRVIADRAETATPSLSVPAEQIGANA